MLLLNKMIVFLLFIQVISAESEFSVPHLTVKIETVEKGVNKSVFDVSSSHVVVQRGNTVQFICEGDHDLQWIYGEDTLEAQR